MKKIYLNAYLDLNIGDDLMVIHLIENFPNYEFGLYSENESFKVPFKNYQNLTFLDSNSKKEFMEISDYILYLGGSIYQIKTNRILLSFIKRLYFLKKSKRKGVKVITLGANFGPYNSNFSEKIVKKILSLHDLIVVRDSDSFEVIKHLPNTYKSNDIVYDIDIKPHLKRLGETDEGLNQNIGVSIYNSIDPKFDNELLRNNYIEYINHILSLDNTKKIKLFSFNSGMEDDSKMASEILNRISNERVVSIVYNGDISNFLQELSSCETILATRFHSAILSDILGIPFYALSYSNKMTDYLSDKSKVKPLKIYDVKNYNLIDYCVDANLVKMPSHSHSNLYILKLRELLDTK